MRRLAHAVIVASFAIGLAVVVSARQNPISARPPSGYISCCGGSRRPRDFRGPRPEGGHLGARAQVRD